MKMARNRKGFWRVVSRRLLTPKADLMGELLRLYLGDGESTSRAFWVGASRVIDSRPLVTGDVVNRVLEALDQERPDDWQTTTDDLGEAVARAKGNSG